MENSLSVIFFFLDGSQSSCGIHNTYLSKSSCRSRSNIILQLLYACGLVCLHAVLGESISMDLVLLN